MAQGNIIAAMARLTRTMLKIMLPAFFLLSCCLGQVRGGTSEGYINGISEILRGGRLSGSLEYWGACNSDSWVRDLPKLQPTRPDKSLPPVDQIRAMFAPDDMMRITKEKDGKVRMVEIDVPNDLLNIKIHHIWFPNDDAYGPYSMMDIILGSDEVRKFRREHNIGPTRDWLPYIPGDRNWIGPVFKSRPPSQLNDVTVAQALDSLTETYPGFWLYESCREADGGRIAHFNFYMTSAPDSYPVMDAAKHKL